MGVLLVSGRKLIVTRNHLQTVIHFILVHHLVSKTSAEEQRKVEILIREGIAPRQLPFGHTRTVQIHLIFLITIRAEFRISADLSTFPDQDIASIIHTCVAEAIERTDRRVILQALG